MKGHFDIALGMGALVGVRAEADKHFGVIDVSHRMKQSNEEGSTSSIAVELGDRKYAASVAMLLIRVSDSLLLKLTLGTSSFLTCIWIPR